MIYIHQYFTLDTEARRVTDENSKELRLRGNAYRLLACMCEKYPKALDIDDIHGCFDIAQADPPPSPDYIRNLRNQIRNSIGYEVIVYKDAYYSIIGDIKRVTESEASDGQENKSDKQEANVGHGFRYRYFKEKPYMYAALAAVILIMVSSLLLAILWPKKGGDMGAGSINEDMVLVPAGAFLMGSTEEEIQQAYQLCIKEVDEKNCLLEDYNVEYPQREIYLGDYYIDRKEVSFEEYNEYVQATGQGEVSGVYANDEKINSPLQPAVGMSWEDARTFCNWRGARLPTEEEWEKAARGTDGRWWPWSNEWNGDMANHGQAGRPGHDGSDGYEYSAPVGVELGPSPYGALNMAGNVFEWVDTEFNQYQGNDKYDNEDFNRGYKVIRGGSYIYTGVDLRVPVRWYWETRDFDIGFRCAKSA